jgi:hypothetical protein
VTCPEHGVTVAAVPWARHGAGHTRAFDDQVTWLATHRSKSAVVELMRVAWRTVGSIASRVVVDARATRDPSDRLVRIGIDEISYRRGHQYVMVVVDHLSGRLVWAAAGHDRATLQKFFDLLGPQRASRIKLISADAAVWIGDVALAACENATLFWIRFTSCGCATRRHVSGGGCEARRSGLSQRSGEAEGSLTPEVWGRAGSSPDNDGTGRHRQTARVRQARQTGVTIEPAIDPPQVWDRLQPGGCGPGSSARRALARRDDSEADHSRRWGGHGECLRRSRWRGCRG